MARRALPWMTLFAACIAPVVGIAGPGGEARKTPVTVGFHLGIIIPSDDESTHLHAGSSAAIDELFLADPDFYSGIVERLGAGFTLARSPLKSNVVPALTIGIGGTYAFHPRLRAALSFSSYKAKATATFPVTVDSPDGGAVQKGRLETEFTGIAAELSARGFLATGATVPFVGAGVRFHRINPDVTVATIAGIGFVATEVEPRNTFGPVAELGLRRLLGAQTAFEGSIAVSGRSVETPGQSRFVIEPELRLGLTVQLSEEEPSRPPRPKEE